MAAKKKPKKRTRKKKSAAHIKGWVTRKINRQEAVLLNAFKKRDTKTLKKLLGLESDVEVRARAAKTVPEWLARMPIELAKQYAELAERTREEKWVQYQDPEFTYSGKRGARKYERGAIALNYSRARHLGKATDEALKLMRAANKKGARELDRVVQRISQALDLPVKEIYTLWFSP